MTKPVDTPYGNSYGDSCIKVEFLKSQPSRAHVSKRCVTVVRISQQWAHYSIDHTKNDCRADFWENLSRRSCIPRIFQKTALQSTHRVSISVVNWLLRNSYQGLRARILSEFLKSQLITLFFPRERARHSLNRSMFIWKYSPTFFWSVSHDTWQGTVF